ncbi:hypothetical protein NDU88_002450 [Pleurodeles waltl]|uniref:Uncharacterized protein n=1 Tax=Pleurodeles waltl TaxID=8319 RepID=A0AAV7NE11_PLEWA|nr:hypothetical protein NDU88_002450 [Pleurodeles waltl]
MYPQGTCTRASTSGHSIPHLYQMALQQRFIVVGESLWPANTSVMKALDAWLPNSHMALLHSVPCLKKLEEQHPAGGLRP